MFRNRYISVSFFGFIFAMVGFLFFLGGSACTDQDDDAEEETTTTTVAQTLSADDIDHYAVLIPPEYLEKVEAQAFPANLTHPIEDAGKYGVWWQGYLSDDEVTALTDDGYTVEEFEPDMECPDADPEPDTFCAYEKEVAWCDESIYDELSGFEDEYDPSYVEVFSPGHSQEYGKEILGVRVGNLTADKPGESSPQVVLIGAQHAQERATPEMIMRVVRHMADGLQDGDAEIENLLSDRTLTAIPVANPDGYDHTFKIPDEVDEDLPPRFWRKNRRPCEPEEEGAENVPDSWPPIGVDLNRHFLFSFGEPSSGAYCEYLHYRGTEAHSEAESHAILRTIGHDGLPGQYVTAVAVDVHTTGNMILLPQGYDDDFNPCGSYHDPYSPGEGLENMTGNCTAPDRELIEALFGTENPDNAIMFEESKGEVPYTLGEDYKQYLGMGGGLIHETYYGDSLPGTTDQTLSTLLELTQNSCGMRAEFMAHADLERVEENFRDLTFNLLRTASGVLDGSFQMSRVGRPPHANPHIHRIRPDVEHPTFRVSVLHDVVDQPEIIASDGFDGETGQEDIHDGVYYQTWYWQSDEDNPFELPGGWTVCSEPDQCEGEYSIGSGPVDLCSTDGWDANGWNFVGQMDNDPADQCYWELDGGDGSYIEREGTISSEVEQLRLMFSTWYRRDHEATVRVLVSDNDFQDCNWEGDSSGGSGSCRIVTTYPMPVSQYDQRALQFQTELLDISDFDGKNEVSLRIEVEGDWSEEFRIYDPLIGGWVK